MRRYLVTKTTCANIIVGRDTDQRWDEHVSKQTRTSACVCCTRRCGRGLRAGQRLLGSSGVCGWCSTMRATPAGKHTGSDRNTRAMLTYEKRLITQAKKTVQRAWLGEVSRYR